MTTPERGRGATNCYGCACNTCANSVELPIWYMTMGEMMEPCFTCDECRHFDGDGKKRIQWRDTCCKHIEAGKIAEDKARRQAQRIEAENKRAKAARAAFTVIKGGR